MSHVVVAPEILYQNGLCIFILRFLSFQDSQCFIVLETVILDKQIDIASFLKFTLMLALNLVVVPSTLIILYSVSSIGRTSLTRDNNSPVFTSPGNSFCKFAIAW